MVILAFSAAADCPSCRAIASTLARIIIWRFCECIASRIIQSPLKDFACYTEPTYLDGQSGIRPGNIPIKRQRLSPFFFDDCLFLSLELEQRGQANQRS